MLQDINMVLACRGYLKDRHELRQVVCGEVVDVLLMGLRQALAQRPGPVLVMAKQNEFVPCMKIGQARPAEAICDQIMPAFVDEDTLDKIFPQHGITQSTLLFHRQVGKVFHQGAGIEATAIAFGHVVFIDPHPFHATTG